MNAISEGSYDKSLFYRSNVLSFCSLIISFMIFVILLLDNISTVKLGELSKKLYSLRLLKAKLIVSSF